ncbi:MAG: DUF5615 family PIN-like protein [Nitrospirae bacterium]|nr:DUF5615 family PIN-like protein [Nitrospirota bacterium]
MPTPLYMDEHIPKAITLALRTKGIDVITVQEDKMVGKSDPELLDRAYELQRVLFTFDDDLLSEAAKRQRNNTPFRGIIYAHPLRVSIGLCVRNLQGICNLGRIEELENQVIFLPLKDR